MTDAGLAARLAPDRSGAVADGWQASGFAELAAGAFDRTLAKSLADAAARWPAVVAVVDRGREISFTELTEIVGGLAQQITEVPVAPGPLALLQSVGVNVVAAWFACGLAGRPFLLLEPGNPPERNRALMTRAGVRLLVSDRGVDPVLLSGSDAPVLICPDGRRGHMDLGRGLPADVPAMIFPTSGSTGEPKMITYAARTLQAKMQASMRLMAVTPGDRVMIAGSHSNYGFLHHALVFLLSGGALHLADVRDGGLAVVFAAVRDHGVRHIRFTPSLFRLAAAHPAGQAALKVLKGVRFSGEPLLSADLELARRMLDPSCRIQKEVVREN